MWLPLRILRRVLSRCAKTPGTECWSFLAVVSTGFAKEGLEDSNSPSIMAAREPSTFVTSRSQSSLPVEMTIYEVFEISGVAYDVSDGRSVT